MEHSPYSIIDRIRQLMPVRTITMLDRPLTRAEAERVAEQQAVALLKLLKIAKPEVEIELVAELPGIEFVSAPDLPHSGTSDWVADEQGGCWLVAIKSNESLWRCRASLAHELKHILDDPFREILYPDWPRDEPVAPPRHAERICDYFAGCVLVPEAWLRQAWEAGFRSPSALSGLFSVSHSMIETRLRQVGLQPRWRPIPRMPEWHQYMRRGYHRKEHREQKRPVLAASSTGDVIAWTPGLKPGRRSGEHSAPIYRPEHDIQPSHLRAGTVNQWPIGTPTSVQSDSPTLMTSGCERAGCSCMHREAPGCREGAVQAPPVRGRVMYGGKLIKLVRHPGADILTVFSRATGLRLNDRGTWADRGDRTSRQTVAAVRHDKRQPSDTGNPDMPLTEQRAQEYLKTNAYRLMAMLERVAAWAYASTQPGAVSFLLGNGCAAMAPCWLSMCYLGVPGDGYVTTGEGHGRRCGL